MISELKPPSTNDNNHPSSNPATLLGENKLQGQMMHKHELFLSKKSLNTQRAKRKEARQWRISGEVRDMKRLKVQETVFKSSKAIKELDLQYTRGDCRLHRKLNYLAENIKRQNSLQKLNLDFSWLREQPYFKQLYPQHNCSLIHNIALQKVHHGLESSDITDEGLVYVERILKRMKNLKNISLDFSQCCLVTAVGLEKIYKTLKKINSLETVNLDLSKCTQIVEKDFHSIVQNLQRVPSLQTVNLRFSGCPQIAGLKFQNLHSYLSQLNSLKHLSLDFSECQINDREVENLCLALKKLTSLPSLTLNLSKCPNFTENGLYGLSKTLQTLMNLKSLTLSFNSCWILYDTGLNIFAGSLKKLTSLKCLSLDFAGCGSVTTVGVNSLSEALKDLVCLQSINLNFASCYKIKALDRIPHALEKLIDLQKINLNFSGCEVSEAGLQKVSQTLDKLPSLKYIKLEK